MSDISNQGAATAVAAVDDVTANVKKKSKNRKAKAGNTRLTLGRAGAWFVLIVIMIASLFPVYWALRTALSTNTAIIQDTAQLTPPEFTTFNFERVLTNQADLSPAELAQFQQDVAAVGGNDVNFNIWLPIRNSVIASSLITFGQVFFCAMAAYTFARLKFKGREAVFTLFLSALMVPPIFALIPNLLLIRDMEIKLGLFTLDMGWLPFSNDQTGWTSTFRVWSRRSSS